MFGVATQNGVGVGIGNIPSLTTLPYATQLYLAVLTLFSSGSPGVFLDANDWGPTGTGGTGVVFQDAYGVSPVTAMEQPVQLILDKHLNAYGIAMTSGANGDYYSTPNAAANQITGDIDVRWYGRLGSLSPSAAAMLVDKVGTAGNYCYTFFQQNTGALTFAYSTDGTNAKAGTSSATIASVGLTTTSLYWLRATLAVATGDVKFYYSTDGSSWTQLGATQSTVAGAIYSGSSVVSIGYRPSATNYGNALWTYRAQVLNGIGGSVVVDFNPARYSGGNTFTAATGEVWTRNGNARIVPLGNHAYVSASANRPTITARYNLLTKTEDFTNAVWGASYATVSAGNLVTEEAGSNSHGVFNASGLAITSGINYTQRIEIRAGTRRYLQVSFGPVGPAEQRNFGVVVDTTTMTIVATGAGSSGAYVSSNIEPSTTAGYYAVTISGSLTATSTYCGVFGLASAAYSINPQSGGGGTWYQNKIDTRPSDQATGLIPTYQRVNTATDYDTVGFPVLIKGNGSNQYLTGNMDLSGTNKVTVWAGVRKTSDAAGTSLFELSANSGVNRNAFMLSFSGQASAGAKYGGNLAGSSSNTYFDSPTAFPAPITNVVTAQFDTTQATNATQQVMRVNGAQVALSFVGTPVSGNMGNYPYYLLSRAGSSLFTSSGFNTIIVLGAAANDAQVSTTEAWVNSKIKAYDPSKSYLLLEDGVSRFLLEDGSGALLLES